MSRAPMFVPIATPKLPPLCIHCKHYIPPAHKEFDRKLGFCQKSGLINVVDGQIHYSNVAAVREYDCKGAWFELAAPAAEKPQKQ